MSGMVIDLRLVYERLKSSKDSQRKQLSPDEEWILWEFWEKKSQKLIAKELGPTQKTLRKKYLQLKEQGGPKGTKPIWMK